MSINPISPNLVNILSNEPAFSIPSVAGDQSEGSFADVLTNSLKTAAELDATDKASAIELLIGKSDNMAALMLDAQKAEISLNLALQIRNKVLDAYNEIMRMQV